MYYKILFAFIVIGFLFLHNISFSQDIVGSKDHSFVSRYPGSVIKYYETNDFLEYVIATGPQTGYKKIDDWIETKGKCTRIYYEFDGTVTLSEIYGNYLSAMEKEGFEILAKGNDANKKNTQGVGGLTWLGTFYSKNPYPSSAGILLQAGSATSGGTCFIAGKLKRDAGSVYVIIGGSEHSATKKVFMIDIVEEAAMKDDLITINAAIMLKGLKADRKIAIYGIFFDVNKYDVKPESAPSLKEISVLLSNNPSLNIYIVGHTDMTGTLEHNMELSQKRADAVVEELISKYGISSGRITAKGVGPLAPLSTNQTDEGKKNNRRVELVEKLN